MGGLDTPANIARVTIKEHANLHKQLWEEFGHWQDELAWKGLSKMIGKDEILKTIQRKNGERLGKSNIGKDPWNKGKTLTEEKYKGGKKNKGKSRTFTESHKNNMSRAASGLTKSQSHKDNLSKASSEFFADKSNRLRASEIMKAVRGVCPKCGMKSNQSNITRHIKMNRCQITSS